MGRRAWGLLLLGVLVACDVYTPLPENVEESWKLMLINTSIKTLTHLATFVEFLGLCNYFDLLAFTARVLEVPPTSDENVTVTDTKFNNIPVRVYVPRRKSDALRRAFISYDLLSRRTADRLDAVVVSTNYRLAPKYHFPIQFEDVYNALKWFLRKNVLEEYGVAPGKVAVSGDSSGGNLTTAVAQQLLHDPEASTGLRGQALLYPALQTLDTDTPSYGDSAHAPVLPRWLALWGWSSYLAGDGALRGALARAGHLPVDAAPLLPRVNWSALLPQRLLRGRACRAPALGSPELARKYPGLLDTRAAPLLAADGQLRGLPLTYVVTCEHDVVRDDGLMYVRRLRDAGVRVAHSHVEDGVHGILSFPGLRIYDRLLDEYLGWLGDNL